MNSNKSGPCDRNTKGHLKKISSVTWSFKFKMASHFSNANEIYVNLVHFSSLMFMSELWLIFLVNWNECEWTWLIFLVNWNLSSTRCGTNNPFKFLFISNFHKESVPYYSLLFFFKKIMHIFGFHILLLFHEHEWT